MANRADPDYWNRGYATRPLRAAPRSDIVRMWLEKHVPRATEGRWSAIEIGCYPGQYLAILGELGYEVHGVDLAEKLPLLPPWLAGLGYRVGPFWQDDFMRFRTDQRFDVVMSLGFIEHWTNWKDVLEKHLALVADHGLLVLEAPNFAGPFQRWLHATLDPQNYRRHHVPAMDVAAWARVVEAHGFAVLSAEYFGRFDFWVEHERRGAAQKLALKALTAVKGFLGRTLPPDRRLYSPCCGLVARRTG